ncbi:hypothetical protein IEE91_12055 [Kocuria sp. cx-455]|uniref:hypothetical protein n=1 Tax=Kocuria sp. cx-455 TaxID=2771377 RepID=UPI0016834EB0|nr:hypothetical protein [Kocuria sp. cx-455]MBD2765908.1 hypothetical protein [Kocuria sp. cx-455]
MTPSSPPSEGPNQVPFQQPQPYPGQNGQNWSTQTLPPQQPKKNQSNILGLIALITAVIGFIFACIPGALIIGWILLPVAFILGLVSLFLQGKSKWMGITALILSIVGTVVGAVVFLVVVSTAFDESFGGGDTTVAGPSEGSDAGIEQNADKEVAPDEGSSEDGTRGNPYPIGSTIENDEWRVVVNSVTPAATDAVLSENDFNEPPADGSQYMLVNYSTTYLGDNADGEIPAFVTVEYVTADGTTVNSFDNIVVAPDPIDTTSTLYTDGTATGNAAFEVPTDTADQGVLAITPGILGDKVFVAVK